MFIEAKAFMRGAKYNTPFAIYATPGCDKATLASTSSSIPDQYKEFQGVF